MAVSGLPPASAKATPGAVVGALICLGGTALLCVLATVIVAGSSSHLGATAAGQVML